MCVCVSSSDDSGKESPPKSGCHANSAGRLHNAVHQGAALNLTLLNVTLACLPASSPPSPSQIGGGGAAGVSKLGCKSVLCV